MKIVVYWEQQSWGGVDTHLLALLSSWPRREDEFLIVYNRGNAGFARIEAQLARLPNIRSAMIESCTYNVLAGRTGSGFPGRMWRAMLYFSQPLLFHMMARRLTRLFKRAGQFDVLLANNGGYPAAWGCLAAMLAAARAGIRARVMLVHHAATAAAPFLGWYERLVDRAVSRAASGFLCVSYATRQCLTERRWLDEDRVPLRVVYNGVSSAEAQSGHGDMVDLRGQTGAVDGEALVGIVGRVEPYKGQEDLIVAMTRLDVSQQRCLRIVVIGAGDPEELGRLRRLAEAGGVAGRVHFVGYLPGDVAAIMRQLDLLVVATRTFEGFGLTLAEAMSVGTPVLATRVGAIPEFVDDRIGRLVRPDSPRELADALTSFVTDRVSWRQRAVLARERIAEFNSMKMADEYRRFFAERLVEQESIVPEHRTQ